ncbi:MAG: tetratricopeptide repeat protein [Treponema sp.]|jgi:tetratricopeptide (TPR) repeat protein|nr:tetratricopeptide repeat protein [Treponema sp.]
MINKNKNRIGGENKTGGRLNPRGPARLLFFLILFTILAAAAAAQTSLQYGIDLYGKGRWREAVIELRRAEAADPAVRSEALYWIALAELAAGEYEASIQDMETLELQDPGYNRIGELSYQKGRALFYLGRYDEAIVILRSYADGTGEYGPGGASRKAAALYWIGECLFALGQLDRAFEVFTIITEQYPGSVKYEAASYRIALINQKKIEAELLAILRWSHEESLKTVEEYQRRERSYDQAIIAYQKRIAELLKDPRVAELEKANADYQRQLSGTESRIASAVPVEDIPEEPPAAVPAPVSALPSERIIRLLSLKAEALELTNELSRSLNAGGPRETP